MYTSHGHQIPGTVVEGERPPVARCGGIGLCPNCSKQAGREFIRQEKEKKVDYKELLKKYIRYVEEMEGTNFLTVGYVREGNTHFTKEEWDELQNFR